MILGSLLRYLLNKVNIEQFCNDFYYLVILGNDPTTAEQDSMANSLIWTSNGIINFGTLTKHDDYYKRELIQIFLEQKGNDTQVMWIRAEKFA